MRLDFTKLLARQNNFAARINKADSGFDDLSRQGDA
jgi:hypothetical protein